MSEILNKFKKKLLGCRQKTSSVEGDERHEARANKRNASPTRSDDDDKSIRSNQRQRQQQDQKSMSFGDKLKKNINVDNIKNKASEIKDKINKK
jgi:hypothetical protein